MRLLFLRGVVVDGMAVQTGTIHEIEHALARTFISQGRAIPAPEGLPEIVINRDPVTVVSQDPEPQPKTRRTRR